MPLLSAYRKNFYSQSGEDGVLEEILRRLEIRTGSFVEFGAWDGKHHSNTRRLLDEGWKGVYIEADPGKYRSLVDNMKPFAERVELIHACVQSQRENTLDRLLATTSIPREFEVLSIDVDSFDWQIWESLRNYSPAVVIIEINSSIPVGIHQTHRGAEAQGSSFSATVDLGTRKGYTAVCHTGNLFFVKNGFAPRLNLPEMDTRFPETLFDYGWKRLSYEEPLPAVLVRLSRVLTRVGNFKNRCRRGLRALFTRSPRRG